jgi:membrane associated rhomboid family serine protease
MQTESTFIEDLKHQYRHGGMTIRLIFLNAIVFLFIQLLQVFSRLIGGEIELFTGSFLTNVFTLSTDPGDFIYRPWGLITSIFAHFTLWHIVMNMLFLWYTYLLGGISGGLLEIIAHLIFPTLQGETVVIVGASGSIMAIFSAMAFYRPNSMVNLFGIFPIRLIWLAGIFILTDLLSLGLNDGTAHFAHLGGVIIGLISVQNIYSSSNLINRIQMFGDKFIAFIKGLFGSGRKLKVKKGGGSRSTQFKSDEEYNMDARTKQAKTDAILDKISKSGYESLTKAEKEFLFNQSKNG